MHKKISLTLELPNPNCEVKIQEVYQLKDKIIAVSIASYDADTCIMVTGKIATEAYIEIPEEFASLPVDHYVITDCGFVKSDSPSSTFYFKSREDSAFEALNDAPRLNITKKGPKTVTFETKEPAEQPSQPPASPTTTSSLNLSRNIKIGAAIVGAGIGLFAIHKLLRSPDKSALEAASKIIPRSP